MIYVIGDIHGCLDPLRRLMAQLRPSEADEVIFLGDYVDRGPDSRGVIEYLLTLRGRYTFLMGNHERMFLDFLQGKERALFLYNGGAATLESYGGFRQISAAHLAFLDRLGPYHEIQDYFSSTRGSGPGFRCRSRTSATSCGFARSSMRIQVGSQRPLCSATPPCAKS